MLINKVSFLLLKKSPSVLTLYSGNILKCPPEQSWKCSLALIIVRSWCLVFLSMNSHSSPQLEQIIAYTRFLVLYDISCITVKVRPFLNVNEAPSIKLGHVDTFLNRW